MEKLLNKLPDDKWYIFYYAEDAYSTKYRIMNNTMINKDSYRKEFYYKCNVRSIEDRTNARYSEKFFFGPFASIFECKLYLRTEKLEWMKKSYEKHKFSYEANTSGHLANYNKVRYESLEGNIRKLEKWTAENAIKRPEYFI